MRLSLSKITACLAGIVTLGPLLTQTATAQNVDHGGSDWTLANGEEVVGVHVNIGVLRIPAGNTAHVKAWNGIEFGTLEIQARSIDIAGVLNGSGRGYTGPGGPGGGGGRDQSASAGGSPGTGGAGGVGCIPSSSGADGSNAFSDTSGGDGRDGRLGRGAYGGQAGQTGGLAGSDGHDGKDGGYMATGRNGDTTTDNWVTMGSGGGSGGSGWGGRSSSVNSGGGGGGGGAAGGNGGSSIRLFASESIHISGQILAAGTLGGNGQKGQNGKPYRGASDNGAAGDGGRGGDACTSGQGLGGPGGAGACDTVGPQIGECSGDGGNGGNGGAGAGGGILLRAPAVRVLPGARINNLGGRGSSINGGTVKIFHGCNSSVDANAILTGRFVYNSVLAWESMPSFSPGLPLVDSLCVGSSISLCARIAQPMEVAYQWMVNDIPIPGANGTCLELKNVGLESGGRYSILASNACGTAMATIAYLTINTPPTLTLQPVSQEVSLNDNVSFCVESAGTRPTTYTWLFNGKVVSGATSSCLKLFQVGIEAAGDYSVVVSNACGSITSQSARLTIRSPRDGVIRGHVWLDLNGNGVQDHFIQGDHPDILFVIDQSDSTRKVFAGSPVGNMNGDKLSNTILDAEIAGFTALNKFIVSQGLADTARIGIVRFDVDATVVPFNTSTGTALFTSPKADLNGNGIPDVEDALRSLVAGGGTDFTDAFDTARAWFNTMGTQVGNGNLVFISDGNDSTGKEFINILSDLRAKGVNMRAFGAGDGASLTRLLQIDSGARIFHTSDELIAMFGGVAQGEYSEPSLGGITVFLDLNGNGSLDSNEPTTLSRFDDPSTQGVDETGDYRFEALPRTKYQVRQLLTGNAFQTLPVADAAYSVDLKSTNEAAGLNFGRLENTQLRNVRVSASRVDLDASTLPGRAYRLESSTDMKSWSYVTAFVANRPFSPLVDTSTTAGQRKFYRLVMP